KDYIDDLKKDGVTDFQQYFRDNPSAIEECIRLVDVINVNLSSVLLNKAKSKADLLANTAALYTKKSKISFQENLVSLIEGARLVTFQTVTQALDGSNIYQIMQWKVLPGYEENWGRVIASVQDISALKQAQSSLDISEASYQNLFNSLDDAIYIQDEEGRFLDVNRGAEKLYGIPKKEIIGRTPAFLSAPEKNDLEDIAAKIQKAFEGEPQEFEFWGKRSNGEIFPKEVRVYKGNYFGKDVIIALGREITKRKETEAALERQLNELNILQATAFSCTQAIDKNALIRQVTNIIGNTLYSDNFGILLLDEETNTLQPHPSYQGVSVEEIFKPYPLSKGITGKVASMSKVLRITDISKSPEYVVFTKSTQSEICVPIKTEEKVLGVINAESSKKDFFTEDDERLLTTIAGQVAIAIEKIRLFETEQKRRQIAEKLQESAAILTTSLSQDKAIELILEELSQVVSFDSASIQLLKIDCLEIIGGRGSLVLETEKDRCFPYPGDNPNTVVIQTGRPLILKNAQDAYPGFRAMPSIQSWLGVPLITHETSIGILTLDSGKINHFTEEDARLVTSFANHAAIAIKNAQLFDAEQKRRQEAETLRKTSLSITESLNLEEAVQRILEALSHVLPYDSASVQILDNNELELFGGFGWENPEDVEKLCFPLDGDNPNTRVILEKDIYILDDAQTEHAPFRLPPHNHIHSWMGVPLIIRDKVIGMLAVDSKEKGYFTEESAKVAQAFANQAAIAVENAQLFDAEQARRQEAEILRETALAITASLNLEEAGQQILEQLSRVLPYDSASLQFLHGNELEVFAGHGWQIPAEVVKHRFPLDGNTPNTRVIQEKNILVLKDAQKEYPPFRLPPFDHIHSWMGVPLIIRDKVIGMLAVDSKEKGYFTEESAKVAQAFANQAAIAVENAQLFDAEQSRRQEAETLRQSAHTISSSLNLDEVLETILASIQRAIPYDSAAIMLLEGDKVRISGGNGLPNMESQIGKTFPAEDPLIKKIIKNSHPLIIMDAQESSYFKNWAETDYVHGWMGVPLIVRGRVIGYITLDNRKIDAYQEKDAELAQTFAHQAASAIENARLYQEALKTAERRAILHRLSQDILSGIQSPEATYQAIHHAAEELMPCDAFIISLRDENTENVDEAVYLVDLEKRYSSRMLPQENSIITLIEKMSGSLIRKNLAEQDLKSEENRFGSKERVRSILISPMRIGEKLIGAISAQSYDLNVYAEEEKVLLEMLASHAAAAIENTRLFDETEQHGKEFAELHRITQDLVAPQDMDNLLLSTLERATNLLGVTCGDIYFYDKKSETLKPSISYGVPKEFKKKVESTHFQNGEGMAGLVAEKLKPQHVDDYQAWDGKSEKYKDAPFTSVLGIPMLYAGNLIGVMNLYEIYPNTHQFSEDDERIMTLFATQVAGAIHSARQFEQIKNRLAELEAVNRISTTLRSAKTPEEMLPLLLKEVSNSLKIDICTIWLSDLATKEVYRAVARGW
ncbi:MAG: GAF domain-containing protein, partial [Anaerolineae bacterium]|nr:GAF domain-containing protein [Anaerolineae bacterium]